MTGDTSLGRSALGLLAQGFCPSCHHDGLVKGPRAGPSTNEACPRCGLEFNVTRFQGVVLMASLNQRDDDRLFRVFGIVVTDDP